MRVQTSLVLGAFFGQYQGILKPLNIAYVVNAKTYMYKHVLCQRPILHKIFAFFQHSDITGNILHIVRLFIHRNEVWGIEFFGLSQCTFTAGKPYRFYQCQRSFKPSDFIISQLFKTFRYVVFGVESEIGVSLRYFQIRANFSFQGFKSDLRF